MSSNTFIIFIAWNNMGREISPEKQDGTLDCSLRRIFDLYDLHNLFCFQDVQITVDIV